MCVSLEDERKWEFHPLHYFFPFLGASAGKYVDQPIN
jgi:hypothetical protein